MWKRKKQISVLSCLCSNPANNTSMHRISRDHLPHPNTSARSKQTRKMTWILKELMFRCLRFNCNPGAKTFRYLLYSNQPCKFMMWNTKWHHGASSNGSFIPCCRCAVRPRSHLTQSCTQKSSKWAYGLRLMRRRRICFGRICKVQCLWGNKKHRKTTISLSTITIIAKNQPKNCLIISKV